MTTPSDSTFAPADKPARGSRVSEQTATLIWQAAILFGSLGLWEVAGRTTESIWISRPSLILGRLVRWSSEGLHAHVATTLTEVIAGLVIGSALGIIAGITLGRIRLLANIMRPIVMAAYSVPLITLTPIFIMYFGLDMTPKIIVVAAVCFFLLLFNTMTGAMSVDQDMIDGARLMGAGRREIFWKVVLPACWVWIVGAYKVALPYSLVAATAGEILASRRGVGFLISEAAASFDMAGLYAGLLILMLFGICFSMIGNKLEDRLLRWRHAGK